MPLSAAVFDPIVFDVGVFDSLDVTPTLWKIWLFEGNKQVQQGESLTIMATLINVETTPGRRFPFNPGETPEIQLYDPDDAVLLAYTDMYNVTVGTWGYQHNVGGSAAAGYYTLKLRALNGSRTMLTPKIKIFEVING